MTTLPDTIKFGKVTWKVISAIGDTTQDADRLPDVTAISGLRAVFTPSKTVIIDKTTPMTIFLSPIVGDFNSDGQMIGSDKAEGLFLIASDSSALDGEPLYYTVSITGANLPLSSFKITPISTKSLDLTNYVVL